MVHKGSLFVVDNFGDRVHKDLLVREYPTGHDCVKHRSIAEGFQSALTQPTVIHGWLRIRISHSEPLGKIEPTHSKGSDWEEKWHTGSK